MPTQKLHCSQEDRVVLEALHYALDTQNIDWRKFYENFSAELCELSVVEGIKEINNDASNTASLLVTFFEAILDHRENALKN